MLNQYAVEIPTLCNCFTVECGSPGILKSMSSSIISRVNSLSVLSIVVSRCTSGAVRVRYSSRVTKVPFAESHRWLIVTESPSGHEEREEEVEERQEVESDGEKTLKERCACPWNGMTLEDKCEWLEPCGM